MFTFILTIFSTFLVRSGIVTSEHSFTYDATNGVLIFSILVLVTIISIVIFCWRISEIKNTPTASFLSKDGGIVANNIILMFLSVAILAGLICQILYEYLYHKSIFINETYYTTVLKIGLLPLLLFITTFTFLKWGNDSIRNYFLPWLWLVIAGIIITCITNSYKPIDSKLLLIILTLGYVLILSLVVHFIKNVILITSYYDTMIPMFLSHIGLASMIIAITLNYSWQEDKNSIMKTNAKLNFADHSIKLESINYYKIDNFYSRKANLVLSINNKDVANLYPETRFYPIEDVYTNESAIYHSLAYDFYVTIGEILPGNKIMINMQYKPFINFIWLGVVLMCSGVFMSIIYKKRKL